MGGGGSGCCTWTGSGEGSFVKVSEEDPTNVSESLHGEQCRITQY